MSSAVFHLAHTAPIWFSVEALDGRALIGCARPPNTPWAVNGLDLHIAGDPTPKVGERIPGTLLPARCPERHIQGDQTFCLGLQYLKVLSAADGGPWWEQLRQFLICQGVAERTRVWPVRQALDHGEAGKYHERALQLAAEAEVQEEYASARLGDPSWITNPSLYLFDKAGRPINGRAYCPRGCTRRARGRLVGIVRKDCPKRNLLVELAYKERQRRKALKEYWEHVFDEGVKCCRTMRVCPLEEHEIAMEKAGEIKD